MRTPIYVVAAVVFAGFAGAHAQSTGGAQGQGAQNTANPNATPGAQAPVNQPRTSAPPSTPTPSTRTSPTPAQATPSSTQTTTPPPSQPTQPNATTQPNSATQPNSMQETVRPPDSRRETRREETTNNPVNNQQRVPPAMRGVGTTGSRPNCTQLRGIEKAECERRDTSRDDLPAGVTTTQPEKPQQ